MRHGSLIVGVAPLTARESVDTFREEALRIVGDVLMLRHGDPVYISQPVCRLGDCGPFAANYVAFV